MARKTAKIDWKETDDGRRKYASAREEAQRKANANGFDHGIEANDTFREFVVFILPQKVNRRGFELRCEVVSCDDVARCQAGHGPCASVPQ